MNLIKSIFNWRLLIIWLAVGSYVALITLCLKGIGAWDISHLKSTVLWSLTAGLVMVFEAVSSSVDRDYFKIAAISGLKVSVLLEFLTNLYVFSLPTELVLLPFATLVGGLLVIAESKGEFKQVRSFLNGVLVIGGVVLLWYAFKEISSDFGEFAKRENLVAFLFPILFTILFLPFVFGLTLFVTYESLFVRMQFLIPDEELRRFTRRAVLRTYHLRYFELAEWSKRLVSERPRTEKEVLATMEMK